MSSMTLSATLFCVRNNALPSRESESGKREIMRKKVLRTKGLLTALLIGAVPLLGPCISYAGVEAILTQDAYTDSSKPTSNFGGATATTLNVKASALSSTSTQKSFIKFDLLMPPGTTGANVKKAILKLFVGLVSAPGSFEVQRVTGVWTEGFIKYSNAPGSASLSTPVFGSVATTDLNDYKTIDITDLVKAGYVVKEKEGRRNRYHIQAHLPLPEPDGRKRTIGEILALLAGTDAIAT